MKAILLAAGLALACQAMAGEDSTDHWGAGGTGPAWYQAPCSSPISRVRSITLTSIAAHRAPSGALTKSGPIARRHGGTQRIESRSQQDHQSPNSRSALRCAIFSLSASLSESLRKKSMPSLLDS